MLSEQSTSKTKDGAAHDAMEALTQARERQEEARRLHDQQIDEASAAETILNFTMKDTLEKAEALEKHVRTVTMRAESLATTEADFVETFLVRQEEAQRHLNGRSVYHFSRHTLNIAQRRKREGKRLQLCASSQAHTRKRLTNAGPSIGGGHFGPPRTRKGEADLKRRTMGRGADDLSQALEHFQLKR